VQWFENFTFGGGATYNHWSTDECTTTYIHLLANKYSGLYSLVLSTFLGFGTEEYSSVLLLSTEEYKETEEGTCFPVVSAMASTSSSTKIHGMR
jgi:hypothetical protein